MCSVELCERQAKTAGFCHTHYIRKWAYGDVREGDPIVIRGVYVEDAHGRIQCVKCERMLPPDRYGVNRNNARGLSRHCKDCERERKRALRDANPERWAELKMHGYHRRRARLAGRTAIEHVRPGDLRSEHGDECCYCGATMTFDLMTEYNPRRASVEHVIPLSRGGEHAMHNLKLACLECNFKKNNKLVDEWMVAA